MINIKNVIVILVALFFIACQPQNKDEDKPPVLTVETVEDAERLEKVYTQLRVLYDELYLFKFSREFQVYGFSGAGPYNLWLKKVKRLEMVPDAGFLPAKGLVAGDLGELAFEYAKAKGKENFKTRRLLKKFRAAMDAPPLMGATAKTGNKAFDKIVQDYELLGKWHIKNSGVNQQYPYEIYFKGNDYVGVRTQGKYSTEILEKKVDKRRYNSDKYYVKDNKWGEYYEITDSLTMLLYDQDGWLLRAGYTAVKR